MTDLETEMLENAICYWSEELLDKLQGEPVELPANTLDTVLTLSSALHPGSAEWPSSIRVTVEGVQHEILGDVFAYIKDKFPECCAISS